MRQAVPMTTPPVRPSAARLRTLRAGDLGWVIGRHGALYAQEHGFDQRFEAPVARIAADCVTRLDPARESAWIAEVDGLAVGCVFLVQARDENTQRLEPRVAQLRLLLASETHDSFGNVQVGEVWEKDQRSLRA